MSSPNQRLTQFTLALVAALVLFAANPAEAGFKFTPAGNGGVSPATPPSAGMPSGILQVPQDVAPAPAISLLPAADNSGAAPVASARAGVVEGFASEVPLTVALRQILPRGVMYSIANDVDVAALVSWKGGRAWQNVLEDMLSRASLRATYNQNTVLIERNIAAAAPNMAPAMTLREPMMIDNTPRFENEMPASSTMGTLVAPQAPSGYTVQSREVTSADPEFSVNAAPMSASASNQQVLVAPDAPQIYDAPAGTPSMAPMSIEPYNETMPGVQPVVSSVGDTGAASAATAVTGWQATAGQSLHEVLADWAQRANIELNWLSEYDYPIQASMTFNGTFEEAVRTLLAGFMNAAPAPVGRLHHNAQLGQLALIIEARGNLYNE